ncbi:hypothetical protein GGQ85_002723 [Nitrobacter vulgaris]|nr:hypothetical protein [Nitrobacter vulgaris]MDR6305007.1 hypothetical protein [Nitrobacter vulgaris]
MSIVVFNDIYRSFSKLHNKLFSGSGHVPADHLPFVNHDISAYPSLTHLSFDRFQLLRTTDGHVVLMLLKTLNYFATAWLYARTYSGRVCFAGSKRTGLSFGFLRCGNREQEDREKRPRNLVCKHCHTFVSSATKQQSARWIMIAPEQLP